jgi:hypothetical protein
VGPAITFRISGLRIRTGIATPVAVSVVIVGAASTAHRNQLTELLSGASALVVTLVVLAVHETVRVMTYRRSGVVVRGLDFSLFGGSPSLLDRTASPRREVMAGSAGIAVLALFTGLALIAAHIARSVATQDLTKLVAIAVASFAIVQTMPALPLDGGRLLRGLVWFLTDDPVLGSRGVAIYGHVVSAGLIVAGLLMMAGSDVLPFWGFGAVVAGLQLIACSVSSMRDTLWQQLGGEVSLAEAGLPIPGRVSADAQIEQVVDALIGEGDRSALLVVDAAGMPAGMIRLTNLQRVRRSDWASHSAGEVMTPLSELPLLPPEMSALDALFELDQYGTRLAVVGPEGGPTYLISRESLLDHVMARAMDPRA